MPPAPAMDLDNLFNGGDRKFTCETIVIGCESCPDPPPQPEDPDLPAESYRIRIDDWSGLRAAVFNREYSTKGSTNPKSMVAHSNPKWNPSSTSKRLTNPKVRTTIIGLPSKIDLAGYFRRPGSSKVVPRSAPVQAVAEPESPKVSCFGRVASEREQETDAAVGCWAGFPTAFSVCGWWRKGAEVVEEEVGVECSVRDRDEPAAMTAPGLGGMKILSSGRRPESWGLALNVGADEHVAR
ncbi:hypothetical protein J5N97_020669 [Dioscorea zingiberensis]|uniref:Uncharacterized protein n=1 Tax=Dioscorea zingiberensis TaxID=325984 RepID=A0A9D5CGZ1_9LILI|nr:hypothetical protein J5N97_020669 [Dioscorea zingiberensis]